jgi:hypothetical protein
LADARVLEFRWLTAGGEGRLRSFFDMDNNIPPEFPPEAPESLYVEMEPPAPSPFALALSELWHDRGLQFLLALTFLVNIALFVYLAIRFNNLSELLPLHFDATGLPDRIDSKNGIYALPLIGVMILMLNTGWGFSFITANARLPSCLPSAPCPFRFFCGSRSSILQAWSRLQ